VGLVQRSIHRSAKKSGTNQDNAPAGLQKFATCMGWPLLTHI